MVERDKWDKIPPPFDKIELLCLVWISFWPGKFRNCYSIIKKTLIHLFWESASRSKIQQTKTKLSSLFKAEAVYEGTYALKIILLK